MSSNIQIELTREVIKTEDYSIPMQDGNCGAIFSFLGTVRNHHYGREVLGLDYTAYDSMALEQMNQIAIHMKEQWPIERLAIIHRLGRLELGEASILICFSMPHRKEGFAALQYAIDTFKEIVPIWKKEEFADGEIKWVEGS